MLNNFEIVDRTSSTEIPGDDDAQIQRINREHNDHTPCRNGNLEVVYMKHPDIPSSKGRSYDVTSASNNNMNRNNNRKNITNIDDDIVKDFCMFEECPGLCNDNDHFNEFYVDFHRNVCRLRVMQFSDIKIDESEPIFCNNTCRADFFYLMVEMTAVLDRKQHDRNK